MQCIKSNAWMIPGFTFCVLQHGQMEQHGQIDPLEQHGQMDPLEQHGQVERFCLFFKHLLNF